MTVAVFGTPSLDQRGGNLAPGALSPSSRGRAKQERPPHASSCRRQDEEWRATPLRLPAPDTPPTEERLREKRPSSQSTTG